jgi:hypothetical protein
MTDLLSVRQDHTELYRTLAVEKSQLPSEDSRFKLQRLLKDIIDLSKNVKNVREYMWLHDALDQWRAAGPALGIPVEQVLSPPDQLSEEPSVSEHVWSEENLRKWIENKGHDFRVNRAVTWYFSSPVPDIVRLFEHGLSPDQAKRYATEDWLQAELYFVAEVIDGSFHLVNDITPESYWRLEGTNGGRWLSEVKKLKAYFRWQARAGGWGYAEATNDYLSACAELRNMLIDTQRKVSSDEFSPIRKYINIHYLDADGKLSFNQDDLQKRTRSWIQTKSRRLSELGISGNTSPENMAKEQMAKFYENINAAIFQPKEPTIRPILEALGLLPGMEHFLGTVNCFEMAIAIYFLDVNITNSILSS